MPPPFRLDDRKSLSIAFLAISGQYETFIYLFFSQKGCRRPFWMTENHFRSHFSPFQINTQLWFLFSQNGCQRTESDQYATFFSQNGCQRSFWMTENRFRSHLSPFVINTQLFGFFLGFFFKMAFLEVRFGPFWMTENHFRFLAISDKYATFFQNDRRPPFWKSDLRQKQYGSPTMCYQWPFLFFRLMPKIIRFL